MTGHNLIHRDASPPIADAPPSHVRAGRGGVRATSNKHHAPTQTEQRQPGRVRQQPKSPKASRSPSPTPRIHERHRPSSRSATGHRADQPEGYSSARGARSAAAPEKSGRRRKPRQPSVTVGNARNRKRFPGGTGLLRVISYWNHQIFCVDWSGFISPQGSHALWDGKIVRQRGWESSRRRHEDASFCFGRGVLLGSAGAVSARGRLIRL